MYANMITKSASLFYYQVRILNHDQDKNISNQDQRKHISNQNKCKNTPNQDQGKNLFNQCPAPPCFVLKALLPHSELHDLLLI